MFVIILVLHGKFNFGLLESEKTLNLNMWTWALDGIIIMT